MIICAPSVIKRWWQTEFRTKSMDSLSHGERAGGEGLLGCNQDPHPNPLRSVHPMGRGKRTPLYLQSKMSAPELISEIIATYQGHGWELRRVLLRPETRTVLAGELFGQAAMIESDFDALWFARPTHAGREAWELRLIAELRYALFEAFEADESEADREEVRLEMENRMREHATSV